MTTQSTIDRRISSIYHKIKYSKSIKHAVPIRAKIFIIKFALDLNILMQIEYNIIPIPAPTPFIMISVTSVAPTDRIYCNTSISILNPRITNSFLQLSILEIKCSNIFRREQILMHY